MYVCMYVVFVCAWHANKIFSLCVREVVLTVSFSYVKVDVIICVGCLIKGETMHFEYIADAVANGS